MISKYKICKSRVILNRFISLMMILVIMIFILPVATLNTEASAYEYAIFPMDTLSISQGVNGSYSHQGTYALDLTGEGSGISNVFAPFTCTIKRIYTYTSVVWIQSNNPVIWADGTIDYMTIMIMHDNNISDLYVGKVIKQGDVFYQEGTAGNATGNHIHLECGKGKYVTGGWYQASTGNWVVYNHVLPYNALNLTTSTKIKNTYGYNWRTISNTTASSYVVTFDGNGGSTPTASKTVTGGSTYGTLPTPTRYGYSWAGWFTSGGVKITSESTVSIASDHTLYAHWTENLHAIWFDVTGGNYMDMVTTSLNGYNTARGENQMIIFNSTDTTGTNEWGYEVSVNSSMMITSVSGNNSAVPSGGYVISAHGTAAEWLKNNAAVGKYVRCDANALKIYIYGSYNDYLFGNKTVYYNRAYGTLPTARRVGYVFDGWYTSAVGGTKITSETIMTRDEGHYIFAHWVQMHYSVWFNNNGGNNAIITSMTVDGCNRQRLNDEFILYNADFGATTNTNEWGYEVVVGPDNIIKSVGIGNSAIPSGGFVYSAHGDAISFLKDNAAVGKYAYINYYTNTAYIGEKLNDILYCNVHPVYGGGYTKFPVATRDGYIFDGWYTQADGGTLVTDDGIHNVEADLTLYAHWTDINSLPEFEYTLNGTEATIIKHNKKSSNVVIPAKIDGYTVVAIADGTSGDNGVFGKNDIVCVTLPSTIVTLGDFAFYDCKQLKSINIPDSVKSIGTRTFVGCDSLSEFTVGSNNSVYKSVDNVLYNKSMTKLLCYPGGITNISFDVPSSVTEINEAAWGRNLYIKYINLPKNLSKIGSYAFTICPELERITVPQTLTEIADNFVFGCDKLTIYGIENSRIHSFATEKGIAFVSIGQYGCGHYLHIKPDGSMSIVNVLPNTTVDALSVKLPSGVSISSQQKYIGTGTVITLKNSQKVTVVVNGDVDGNGEINTVDYIKIKRAFQEIYTLDGYYNDAADVDGDGLLTVTDFLRIKRHFQRIISLF